MKRFALIAIFLALAAGTARADNCGKSREYLLGSLGGDLALPPQAYEDLFKICLAAAAMANVRDAYILKDGGIAVDCQNRTASRRLQRRSLNSATPIPALLCTS